MPGHRLIRLKQVLERVPLSRSTIYARIADGSFPAQVDLGGGVVAWRESEIDSWIDGLPKMKHQESGGIAGGIEQEAA